MAVRIGNHNLYIVFIRYTHFLSKEMKFSIETRCVGKKTSAFSNFIKELVSFSEGCQCYINVYRIWPNGSSCKIAFIDLGKLYTL